ncbi:MAG TPA: ankyrin repeat domain-containing protein [Pontiella sp.]
MTLLFKATLTAASLLCLNVFAGTNEVDSITPQEVIEAALYGKTNTISKALASGFKVDSRDPDSRTALMFAAFNGQTGAAKLLIGAGADVNAQDRTGTSALMFAASAPGGTETVQLLIDAGAKVNITDSNEHFTALMWAAAEGQLESVKLLLKHGADAALKDIDGDKAENFAASKGHAAIVKLLQQAVPMKEKPTKEDAE